MLAEVSVDLIPRVPGIEPLTVHFVWHPTDGDLHAGDVRIEKLFRASCTSGVSLAEDARRA